MSNPVDSSDLPAQFGPYTLLRRLAVGGMAEVYVAKTRGMGGFEKRVALKLIHPRFSEDEHFVQMLVEEAKLSVLLTHRNIVQTFDLGSIGNTYFIVMEYVEGADGSSVAKRARALKQNLPFDVCAYVMAEVCTGLDYAHRRRSPDGKPLHIVHRDISPQNVLVSFSGEVKIADFGIAKFSMREEETMTGVIKGKYHYMSPEQAWGDPTDHRSDIFSAGVVLYELLTGEMLHQTGNIPMLLDKVRKAEIPPPNTRRADIPWELTDIVMRAVAKRPGDRYQSAYDMAEALRRYVEVASPAFSPERLSDTMLSFFAEGAHQSTVALLPSKPPPVASAPAPATDEDSSLTVETVDMALPLMSREEFEPDPDQSIIFALKDLERPPSKAPQLRTSSAPEARATFRPPALAAKDKAAGDHASPGKPSVDKVAVELGAVPFFPPAPKQPSFAPFADRAALEFDDATQVDDGAALRAGGVPQPLFSPPLAAPPPASTAPVPRLPPPARLPAMPATPTAPAYPAARPEPFVPSADQGPTARLRAVKSPPPPSTSRRWLLAAALLVPVLVLGGWLGYRALVAAPVLEVNSSPPGATILLDGHEIAQRTPATIRDHLVRGKTHAIEVRLPGYQPRQDTVVATEDRIHKDFLLLPR